MKTAISAFLAAALLTSIPAYSCGFCGGDKAASVYSFKNKKFAEQTGSKYVVCELVGDGSEESFTRAVDALKRLKGVYGKTVRAAYAQKSVSFVIKSLASFDEVSRAFAEREAGWSLKRLEDLK